MIKCCLPAGNCVLNVLKNTIVPAEVLPSYLFSFLFQSLLSVDNGAILCNSDISNLTNIAPNVHDMFCRKWLVHSQAVGLCALY